ncbi:MAG: CHAT domain-containing tetratricopeptide repeat protein [Pseudomonadota bacterium]
MSQTSGQGTGQALPHSMLPSGADIERAIALMEANDFEAARDLLIERLQKDIRAQGETGPATIETADLLAEAFMKTGQPDQAEPLFTHVFYVRNEALGTLHPITMRSAHNVALSAMRQGKYEDALDTLRPLMAARQQTLGWTDPETRLTGTDLVETLNALGRSEEAYALLEQLAPQTGASSEEEVWQDLSEQNLDVQLNETLPRIRATFGAEHPMTLSTESTVALGLVLAGRLTEALPLLEHALQGQDAQLGAEHPETIKSRGAYIRVLNRLGRTLEAAEESQRNLQAIVQSQGATHPDVARAILDYARVLEQLGRVDEAIALIRQGLDLAARNDAVEESTEFALTGVLVRLLQQSGRAAEADEILAEAKRRSQGLLEDHIGSSVGALLNSNPEDITPEQIAAVYSAVVQQQGETSRIALQLQALLGLKRIESGDPVGLKDLEMAAQLAEQVLGPSAAQTVQMRGIFASGLVMQGQHYAAMDQVDLLTGIHLSKFGQLEQTGGTERAARGDALAEAARLGVRAGLMALRSGGDRAALAERTFELAQLTGLGGAQEAMARGSARIAARDPGARAATRDWDAARVALSEAEAVQVAAIAQADRPLIARAAQQIAQARLALSDIEDEVKRDFPAFFDLVQPRSLSLDEVQAQLTPQDTLIVLSAPTEAGGSGFVWAVSQDQIGWSQISMEHASLRGKISRLHAQLDRRGAGLRAPGSVQPTASDAGYEFELAYELFEALFGSTEIQRVVASRSNWILVPQDMLISLPFAALVERPVERMPEAADTLRQAAWLGLNRSLSVLPAVTALARPSRSSQPAQSDLAYVGFGDPNFSGTPEPLDLTTAQLRTANGIDLARLPRLPGTRREVETLAQLLGADQRTVFLGSDASEAELRAANQRGDLARARIVHFATHGLLAGAFGGQDEPALALSPPRGDGTAENDGLLTATEAASLDLLADWVILSACDTAAGEGPDANGLTGLAAGFLYAGAKSLLVSHWAVQDDIAARLTANSVGYAEAGLPRAAALQAAMAEIVADPSRDTSPLPLSHPSVWAPFLLIGR